MSARAALLCLAFACACTIPGNPSPELAEPISDGRYAMGTIFEIAVHGGDRDLLDRLYARVEELESRISNYRPDSDVSRLSAAAGRGPQPVHPEVVRLLEACLDYTRLTRGTFDITIGPLVNVWRNAGETGRLPPPDALSLARARVGSERSLRVQADPPSAELLQAGMQIDVGGIAKGTATDALLEMLDAANVEAALLNFGGSSQHAFGAPPGEAGWRVLLRDGSGSFAGVMTLRDLALSVSSSLGQYVEIEGVRYGHVLDPRSGEPVRAQRQAVVVSRSGELAEAVSKALLVLPADEALAIVETLDGTEAALFDEHRAMHATSGFAAATRLDASGS